MVNFFVILLISVLLTEGLVQLLAKSAFFAFFRDYISDRSEKSETWFFINSIMLCPYCLSVWVSGLIVLLLYLSSLVESFSFGLLGVKAVDLVLLILLSHRLSNHFHNFCDCWIDKYYRNVGK